MNPSNTTNVVRDAIRRGELTRDACEVCGSDRNVDAHHDDYTKPLDVRWLCRSCHQKHHHIYCPPTPRDARKLLVKEILCLEKKIAAVLDRLDLNDRASSGPDELRAWIERQGLTQAAAAKVIGVLPIYLWRWMFRKGKPSLAMALRLQDATGISARAW